MNKEELYRIFTPARSMSLFALVMLWLGFLLMARDISDNRYHRIADMPAEIRYQIHDLKHGYSYYTSAYTLGDGGLITATNYWTFNWKTHAWEYYQIQFRLIGVDATVDELERGFKTISQGENNG